MFAHEQCLRNKWAVTLDGEVESGLDIVHLTSRWILFHFICNFYNLELYGCVGTLSPKAYLDQILGTRRYATGNSKSIPC